MTGRLISGAAMAIVSLLFGAAQAAVPGITGAAATPSFDLVATPGYVSQPDGASVYVGGALCSAFGPLGIPDRLLLDGKHM